MSLVQYMPNTRRIAEVARVTVGSTKAGNLYINTFAMRKHLSGKKYVKLFIDSENGYFRIYPANEGDEGAYKLGFSSQKSKSTGYIAAKGFTSLPLLSKHKGISLPAEWKKEGYLEVKLEK